MMIKKKIGYHTAAHNATGGRGGERGERISLLEHGGQRWHVRAFRHMASRHSANNFVVSYTTPLLLRHLLIGAQWSRAAAAVLRARTIRRIAADQLIMRSLYLSHAAIGLVKATAPRLII